MGLDLAWSARNLSGGAVMVEGALQEARADLGGDEEIVRWVGGWLQAGASAVLAVDAPLRVPNWEGRRHCEAEVGAAWGGKRGAGPYPSNRRLFHDDVRGERLVRRLGDEFGFVEAVPVVAAAGTRIVCEVYPHPALISLFRLEQRLVYKKKGGRTYAECWAGLALYQQHLKGLVSYDPPLHDPFTLLNLHFEGQVGKALKALEDILDAVSCAYIATYLWRHGAAGTWSYGSVAEGHILVPRVPPLET
jgi:predicted RNase H-like nuclease